MSGYVWKYLLERIDNCNAVLNDFAIGCKDLWNAVIARRGTHHFTKGWIARQPFCEGDALFPQVTPNLGRVVRSISAK